VITEPKMLVLYGYGKSIHVYCSTPVYKTEIRKCILSAIYSFVNTKVIGVKMEYYGYI